MILDMLTAGQIINTLVDVYGVLPYIKYLDMKLTAYHALIIVNDFVADNNLTKIHYSLTDGLYTEKKYIIQTTSFVKKKVEIIISDKIDSISNDASLDLSYITESVQMHMANKEHILQCIEASQGIIA